MDFANPKNLDFFFSVTGGGVSNWPSLTFLAIFFSALTGVISAVIAAATATAAAGMLLLSIAESTTVNKTSPTVQQ